MAKVKISGKQKGSSKRILTLKKGSSVVEYSPTANLLDENFMGKVILECLKDNDPEGVIEVIETYLDTVNKVQALKGVQLPRSTLYHTLKGKNPTLKTLAKIVHSSTSLPVRR